MLELDRKATQELFALHVPCNEKIANHNTIQVEGYTEGYKLRVLGVLNGIFGISEFGIGGISMNLDKGDIVNFSVSDVENFK